MQWFPIQRPSRTWDAKRLFNYLETLSNALQWRGPDTKRRLGGNPRDKKETRLTAGWWKDFMLKSIQQWLSKLWHEMPFRFTSREICSLVGRNFRYHICMQLHPEVYRRIDLFINNYQFMKNTTMYSVYFWPWVQNPGPTLTFIILTPRAGAGLVRCPNCHEWLPNPKWVGEPN